MTCGFKSGPHSWHPIKLTKQAKFKLLPVARNSLSCVIKMSLFIFNDFQLPWRQLWVTQGGGCESLEVTPGEGCPCPLPRELLPGVTSLCSSKFRQGAHWGGDTSVERLQGWFPLLEMDVGSGNLQLEGTAHCLSLELVESSVGFATHTPGGMIPLSSHSRGKPHWVLSLSCPCTK